MTDQRFVRALFSYEHAAVLAGLGTLGRNSLLITPEFGPRVPPSLPPDGGLPGGDTLVKKDLCAGCNACIRECPAQAIQEPEPGQPYALNRFALQGLSAGRVGLQRLPESL